MPQELRNIPNKLPDEEKKGLRKVAAEWRAKHCWHPHQLRHTAGTTVSSVIVGNALIVLGAYWGLQRAGRGAGVEDRSRRMS